MQRLASTLRPATLLFAAALFAVAAPLSAQQVAAPAPATEAAAAPAPANAPAEPLPGPRLREQWQRVEPNISGTSESRLMHKSNQTITVSTLVLVLAVVILVLLIA